MINDGSRPHCRVAWRLRVVSQRITVIRAMITGRTLRHNAQTNGTQALYSLSNHADRCHRDRSEATCQWAADNPEEALSR